MTILVFKFYLFFVYNLTKYCVYTHLLKNKIPFMQESRQCHEEKKRIGTLSKLADSIHKFAWQSLLKHDVLYLNCLCGGSIEVCHCNP
jgi:hypothetical protein